MAGTSAQQLPDEETGRDARLKLILLVVALVLVAGYAATLTDFLHVVEAPFASLSLSGLPLLPIGAGVLAVCCIAALIIVRRRRGGRTAVPASTDALAAMAGRQQFMQRLAEQIDANAKAGRQLALHLVDLDRFHRVNEVMGEGEGDAFLRLVAERLLALVSDPQRVARIGDDEFAIIQPEAGGARHAEIYARRILDTLKDACSQRPRHARPGASIGVAVSPDHGADVTRLLHSASLALGAAKAAGGDNFRGYAREMEMSVQSRLQIEKSIGDGLSQGWFELHFQPQYDLRSRRLTGFEALVRMNNPEMGEQLPAAFLPMAEESGLIQPLGEWIIREAVGTAAQWPQHLTLSINISPAQLRQGDVAGSLLKALSNSNLDPSRLRVEISEAVLLQESEAVDEQLRRLKARGVTIVLDDFGLDGSKLQSLARSPCNAVKLDRTLIERVGEEPEVENLVRSLIGTAQAFELDILAEGVERAEQVRFLMSNACENVQGFLFGRPARASELGAIIGKDMRKAVDGGSAPEASAAVA
jgi:diguanylate cyclase (GGDEF)-like protein